MENNPIKLYIHAPIVHKKQGSAVLITIRCEKTRCEKEANRVLLLSQLFRRQNLFSWRHLEISSDLLFRILSGFAVMIISFSVKHRSHR